VSFGNRWEKLIDTAERPSTIEDPPVIPARQGFTVQPHSFALLVCRLAGE
jgi:hypothetical protein